MRSVLYRLAAVVLFCVCVTGCGSTSQLAREEAAPTHDLSSYPRVAVGAFGSRPATDVPAGKRAVYDNEVKAAGQRFATMVVSELRRYGIPADVVRERPASALYVEGDITRYKDGNAALRFLIGFGAGSSYFDATVRFVDGDSGRQIGSIEVDKNSWPLGGLVAAAQDADSHMQGAAAKIAEQIAIAQGRELPTARERTAKRVAKPAVACGRGGCRGD